MSKSVTERRYSDNHSWAVWLENGRVRLGASRYGIEQMGQVVYMTMPSENDYLTDGSDIFVELESTKSVISLATPIYGVVKRINPRLTEDATLVELNNDAEGKGWICEIEPDAGSMERFSQMMSEADYKFYCESL